MLVAPLVRLALPVGPVNDSAGTFSVYIIIILVQWVYRFSALATFCYYSKGEVLVRATESRTTEIQDECLW